MPATPTRLPNYTVVARNKAGTRTVYRYCYTKRDMLTTRRSLGQRFADVRVFKAAWKRV
jgi:hypothetical protein